MDVIEDMLIKKIFFEVLYLCVYYLCIVLYPIMCAFY